MNATRIFLLALLLSIESEAQQGGGNIAFIQIGTFVAPGNRVKTYFVPRHYRVTHSAARSLCKVYDMDLAMLQTLNEFNAVSVMCRNNEHLLTNAVHIDGMTAFSASTTEWFFTRNGQRIAFNMPWGPGQPDDHRGIEKCLTLGSSRRYLANDFSCNTEPSSFLCETTH